MIDISDFQYKNFHLILSEESLNPINNPFESDRLGIAQ